jgi:hypothetical protein
MSDITADSGGCSVDGIVTARLARCRGTLAPCTSSCAHSDPPAEFKTPRNSFIHS